MPNSILKGHVPNWLSYALTFTGLTGLTGVILIYIYQCKLIYPASYPEGSRQSVAVPSDYGMEYNEVDLKTKDGVNLKSYIIIRPNVEEAKRMPTILYFHANAGNMGHRLPIAKILHDKFKCNVAMLSYRGYGKSEGSPNEKGLRIDAQTMLDYIREHTILKNTPLIAYGQSIGGAVAIDLVARNENSFSGLMIENTFLSLPKLIPTVIPFLKHFTFLCHQQWPSEKNIQRIVKTPILFLAGAKDELVPPIHMVKLKDLSETRAPKIWIPFPNGTHNNTCMQPGYFTAIHEFLERYILKQDVDDAKNGENTLDQTYIDGQPVNENNDTSSTLMSGTTDVKGITHNLQVEEIELEEAK
ncbi:Alpha/Beta hydrolase protein [Cokeromyces recurvatus]|uniref:Alpha/Beta hydrolase protein n=1 Tax=Cokeromyces recurvatus TaxID=90255 RepID=UPI0022206301|nr:Alpha/Beta hydrolase protein [Cokeromyces recurvatus]KAI7903947.1 Alpha/Beta hydrolase protein [Cokeromyces recurvatus]